MPLLNQGKFPCQIVTSHSELGITDKTLNNCIEWLAYDVEGVKTIDFHIKITRRLPKKSKGIQNARELVLPERHNYEKFK